MNTGSLTAFHRLLFSQASRKVIRGAPLGYLKFIGGWQILNLVVWALASRRALRSRRRRIED